MITLSIGDAQAQLPKLLTLVSQGNEVIISADNKPIAKIVPFAALPRKRTAGLNKGKVRMGEDFDDPLPESFWSGAV